MKLCRMHLGFKDIVKIKALISEHGLTVQDIFGNAKRGGKAGTRAAVAPKYRDPATGATETSPRLNSAMKVNLLPCLKW